MDIEDLKKLDREIDACKDRASRLRDEAKDVAHVRKNPFRVRVSHPDSFSSNYKDDALHRVWEEMGARIMRLIETDLLEQARKEQMTADLLQARLDKMLAAAGDVAGEEPKEESSGE